MPYVRKTADEHQIWSDFGDGPEEVTAAATWKECRQLLKEYRENSPEYRYWHKRKRVKVTA